MPRHTVEQGDCLNNIAEGRKFLWKTLWNHPENLPLKTKRKDPNILFPGDVVYIPEKQEGVAIRPTDARHKFTLETNKCKLNIRLLRDDKPRANEPYQIDIDGASLFGQTDSNGALEHVISADARIGKLVMLNTSEEYPLLLGYMDPITEIAGIQKRLQNLGFYIGKSADGILGPKTASGVRKFQRKYGLVVDGEPGPITQAKLKEVYGC